MNTFYLWGWTEFGNAIGGVSLFTGPNVTLTNPSLSSWYSFSANTLSVAGLQGMTDFNSLAPAGPLTTLIDGFNVTIPEFSFASVNRGVQANSYQLFYGPERRNDVAKLVLTVAPAPIVVPEPSTYLLMASGLGMLALFARRRSAA